MGNFCSQCGHSFNSKYEHICNNNVGPGYCSKCGDYGGSEFPCRCYNSVSRNKGCVLIILFVISTSVFCFKSIF